MQAAFDCCMYICITLLYILVSKMVLTMRLALVELMIVDSSSYAVCGGSGCTQR